MLRVLFLALIFLLNVSTCAAEKILFIPHDDRPVSFQQPVEVIEQLGYEIISPPSEILAQPDELWTWFFKNTSDVDAAVVSSDALLYGGLIPSRSHQISAEVLNSRVENFKSLRENNPALNLYVFGSLMRTPQFGTPGDIEEPDYYGEFGADIFQLTKLLDKQETSKLTRKEKFYLQTSKNNIPNEFLNDYFARREKNLNATKKIIDFTDGIIDFFVIGRDDNSPLSQTHRENRILNAYMQNIPKSKAQSLAGIDEFAILLLARAVNDLNCDLPFVNLQFNRGSGEKTIPAYSSEPIINSIRDQIIIAGAISVQNPARADFILAVNTDPNGKTFHTHNSFPPQVLSKRQQKYLTKNAQFFSAQIKNLLDNNFPVGVADISFANGSDNALMNHFRDKNLLFKLQSYAGWNTATNSTGFALATGILAKKMSTASKDRLLTTRYLDDWAFQANVRSQIADKLSKRPDGLQIYLNLENHESEIVNRENFLMKDFAAKNLPQIKNFSVSNPWNRMFECKINFD